jgi:hypothetical protein
MDAGVAAARKKIYSLEKQRGNPARCTGISARKWLQVIAFRAVRGASVSACHLKPGPLFHPHLFRKSLYFQRLKMVR